MRREQGSLSGFEKSPNNTDMKSTTTQFDTGSIFGYLSDLQFNQFSSRFREDHGLFGRNCCNQAITLRTRFVSVMAMLRQLARNVAIRLVSSSPGRPRKMARQQSIGTCEHCQHQFGYWLEHCGFGDCVYAYRGSCGKVAVLSQWDKRMPKLPNCPGLQEMCSAMEPYVQPCECGGALGEGQHHDVRTAINRCRLRLPHPTSKPTRRAPQRAGAGSGTGAELTASSSKNGELRTTSYDPQLLKSGVYTQNRLVSVMAMLRPTCRSARMFG